jgi:hypothetical protein
MLASLAVCEVPVGILIKIKSQVLSNNIYVAYANSARLINVSKFLSKIYVANSLLLTMCDISQLES